MFLVNAWRPDRLKGPAERVATRSKNVKQSGLSPDGFRSKRLHFWGADQAAARVHSSPRCAQVCGGQRLDTCEHPAGRTVHYYTAEESLDKVLKKRMRIANVAMGKMIFPLHNPQGYITDQLRLPNDIQRTEEWIKEDKVQLVVIDPITSFCQQAVNHRQQGHWRMIEQLIQVCLRNSVAMVMTLHDNKSTEGNTLDRFSGGDAWTQTPRNVIRLAKDAIVPGRWVMMSEKNQVGGRQIALLYHALG